MEQEYKDKLWAQYLIIKEKVCAFTALPHNLIRDRAKYRETMTALSQSLNDAIRLRESEIDNTKTSLYEGMLIDYQVLIPVKDRRRVVQKREIPRLCQETYDVCFIIEDMLKEAYCFGDIMGNLWDDPDAKLHFASQQEIADYEAEEARKAAEYEEQRAWNEALSKNDYPAILSYLEKHAIKKDFIHPTTREPMYYYKLGERLYTSEGRRFGFTKIKEWGLDE